VEGLSGAGPGPSAVGLKLLVLLVAAGLLTGACRTASDPSEPARADGPRLLLMVVVDQLRADYLERFRPVLSGGLARLLEESVVFPRALHDHAATVTGAGHATLVSGVHPGRSGIIANRWYDRETGEEMYCVGDPEHGRSPANLEVSTLPGWLRQHDPDSRAFSVGGKDRSAILMGGRDAEAAFWYDADSGGWTTSSYYRRRVPRWVLGYDPLPGWVQEFNDRRLLDRHFGTAWEPLPVPPATLQAMDIVDLDRGVFRQGFPHRLGEAVLAPDEDFYDALWETPFVDEHMVEFVRTLVEQEALGTDAHLDYLGVAFSGPDLVGHDWGPNSRELLDAVMRVDRALEELLDVLEDRVGRDRLVVVLSSDHGVVPLPEYRNSLGLPGTRVGVEETLCFQRVRDEVRRRHGDLDWVEHGFYLDRDAIEEAGLDFAAFQVEVAALLETCPGVEKVWTRAELSGRAAAPWQSPGERRFRELYAHSFHPRRSADLLVQLGPWVLDDDIPGTTHGSPYEYDRRVPVMIRAPGLAPAVVDRQVRTVNVAPTLAALLGLPVPAGLDGAPLTALPRLRGEDTAGTGG